MCVYVSLFANVSLALRRWLKGASWRASPDEGAGRWRSESAPQGRQARPHEIRGNSGHPSNASWEDGIDTRRRMEGNNNNNNNNIPRENPRDSRRDGNARDGGRARAEEPLSRSDASDSWRKEKPDEGKRGSSQDHRRDSRSSELMRNSIEQERLAMHKRRAAESHGVGNGDNRLDSWLDDPIGKPGGANVSATAASRAADSSFASSDGLATVSRKVSADGSAGGGGHRGSRFANIFEKSLSNAPAQSSGPGDDASVDASWKAEASQNLLSLLQGGTNGFSSGGGGGGNSSNGGLVLARESAVGQHVHPGVGRSVSDIERAMLATAGASPNRQHSPDAGGGYMDAHQGHGQVHAPASVQTRQEASLQLMAMLQLSGQQQEQQQQHPMQHPMQQHPSTAPQRYDLHQQGGYAPQQQQQPAGMFMHHAGGGERMQQQPGYIHPMAMAMAMSPHHAPGMMPPPPPPHMRPPAGGVPGYGHPGIAPLGVPPPQFFSGPHHAEQQHQQHQ